MKLRFALAAALALAASPAAAQAVIAPGMTPAQVRGVFGAPAATRDAGDWSYWYYLNGCPVRCGSDDVVFFRDHRVVAAVLRTSRRRFAGPEAFDALARYDTVDAAGGGGGAAAPSGRPGIRVGGVRLESGGEAGGRVAPPARAGSEAARESGMIIIRDGERQPSSGRPPPVGSAGAVRDTTLEYNDERRAREGRVEPNSIPGPDTTNAAQRARERSNAPRVVPRNP